MALKRFCDPSSLGLERCTLGRDGGPAFTERTRCTPHEREWQQRRNADPKRKDLYAGDWPAESRRIRAAHPFCSDPGCDSVDDLTVDHPTRRVFCRRHHGALEARRRAEASAAR